MTNQNLNVYNFFTRQGFLPAKKDSFPVYRMYEKYSSLAEMNATIIAAWSFAYNGLYKIIHGYLCSVFFYVGKPIYFSVHCPIQQSNGMPDENPEYSLKAMVDILYDLSLQAGLPALQIKFVEERFLSKYQAIDGYEIAITHFEDDSEYVYRAEDFLNLSGNINKNKRERITKCLKNPNIEFVPITNANIDTCLAMEDSWCEKQDCEVCESFSGCEKKAMEIMVDIFDEQIFKGLLILENAVPIGYIIGQKINEKLAFLHFGKVIAQDYFVYLLHTMVKTYFEDIAYLNTNEDMGKQGLRVFKTHLGRYEHWIKYICTFTKK